MKTVTTQWVPEEIRVGEQPDGDLLALFIIDGRETVVIPLSRDDAGRIARALVGVDDEAHDHYRGPS